MRRFNETKERMLVSGGRRAERCWEWVRGGGIGMAEPAGYMGWHRYIIAQMF